MSTTSASWDLAASDCLDGASALWVRRAQRKFDSCMRGMPTSCNDASCCLRQVACTLAVLQLQKITAHALQAQHTRSQNWIQQKVAQILANK